MKNLKANLIQDSAAVIILFFWFMVLLFALDYAANQVIQVELNLGLITTNSQAYILGETVLHNYSLFNDWGVLLFFALNILAIFLAAYLRPSIMNVTISLILIWFLPIFSAIISNVARTVFLTTQLSGTAAQFPALLAIAAQFPIYTIGFTLLYIVVIAVRSRYFQGNRERESEVQRYGA